MKKHDAGKSERKIKKERPGCRRVIEKLCWEYGVEVIGLREALGKTFLSYGLSLQLRKMEQEAGGR